MLLENATSQQIKIESLFCHSTIFRQMKQQLSIIKPFWVISERNVFFSLLIFPPLCFAWQVKRKTELLLYVR